jgi:hypothetical protein
MSICENEGFGQGMMIQLLSVWFGLIFFINMGSTHMSKCVGFCKRIKYSSKNTKFLR